MATASRAMARLPERLRAEPPSGNTVPTSKIPNAAHWAIARSANTIPRSSTRLPRGTRAIKIRALAIMAGHIQPHSVHIRWLLIIQQGVDDQADHLLQSLSIGLTGDGAR